MMTRPAVSADDPHELGYGSEQVCHLAGISYRQLDYWARCAGLEPSIAFSRGVGTRRRYSYSDVMGLKAVKALREVGVPLRLAGNAVTCLREHSRDDLSSATLVLTNGSWTLTKTHEELVDLMTISLPVLVLLPLAPVLDELDQIDR